MATVTTPELEDVESTIIKPGEHYEIVGGLIVEEPPLGMFENRLANRLLKMINLFDPPGDLGEAVLESLFILEHTPRLRRRPDVAFVPTDRLPNDPPTGDEAAWDVIPDLTVEIASPSDLIEDLMDKIEEYFRVGVRLVWVIYPRHRKIYTYNSPSSVKILVDGDSLDGGPVLPGFRVALTTLFELRGGGPTPVA